MLPKNCPKFSDNIDLVYSSTNNNKKMSSSENDQTSYYADVPGIFLESFKISVNFPVTQLMTFRNIYNV